MPVDALDAQHVVLARVAAHLNFEERNRAWARVAKVTPAAAEPLLCPGPA